MCREQDDEHEYSFDELDEVHGGAVDSSEEEARVRMMAACPRVDYTQRPAWAWDRRQATRPQRWGSADKAADTSVVVPKRPASSSEVPPVISELGEAMALKITLAKDFGDEDQAKILGTLGRNDARIQCGLGWKMAAIPSYPQAEFNVTCRDLLNLGCDEVVKTTGVQQNLVKEGDKAKDADALAKTLTGKTITLDGEVAVVKAAILHDLRVINESVLLQEGRIYRSYAYHKAMDARAELVAKLKSLEVLG